MNHRESLPKDLEVIAHVYAKRYSQEDIEQQLPERHTHKICFQSRDSKRFIVPIQPDLLKRDQIKVSPPRISHCRCPVRKRQADQKKADQHVEDITIDDQSPVF